jgi:hypothetical protein
VGSEKNWAAVGAIAGLASVFIALLAYADDNVSSSPPQIPATTPAQTREVPDTSRPEPEPTTSTTDVPVTATPTRTGITPPPSLSLQPQRPLGCDEAIAAINEYNRTAGSAKSSQAAAASQARQNLMGASLSSSGGAVYSVIVALSRDFQNLEFILTGMVAGDYAAAVARTNDDIDTLRNVCTPS